MWGELASHNRLFNPPPQFSRLGTQCPALMSCHVMCICVCVLYGHFGVCGYMLVVFIYLFLYLSIYLSTYGWYAMNYNFIHNLLTDITTSLIKSNTQFDPTMN